MGYLFENAEKMDIQAERRKTAEAREQIIQVMIESAQEFGVAKSQVIIKVAEKCNLTQTVAEEKVELYWKV